MSNDDHFHYQFIHNVFGCFIENTLEYFGDYFYPRFQHKIVGTYDKAVQYIVNQERDGKEVDKPNLPALILNPSGDFALDDANAGGKQFWRFPHLAPGLAQRIFDPIYLDRNIEITVAFTRLKGEIELLSLLPSFYEYFDLKLFIIQMFGGEGRYISPIVFNDFIILPPELVNYEYNNIYTGESYKLDWKKNGAYEFLVETTNKNELIIPGKIKPRFVLRGLTDGSTRYGGTDDIADWKLSAMVEYEIEIPSYLIVRIDHFIENVTFGIGYGSLYSKYPEFNLPQGEISIDVHVETPLRDKENTPLDEQQEAKIQSLCDGQKIKREVEFKTRYFHIVTQEQQDATEDIIIQIPEKVYDISLIKVQSKSGLMLYGSHYIIEPSSNEIRIKIENVFLKKGDVLEIFIYETPFHQENPIFLFGGSSLISTTRNLYNRPPLNVKWAFRSTAKCKSSVIGEI